MIANKISAEQLMNAVVCFLYAMMYLKFTFLFHEELEYGTHRPYSKHLYR